MVSNTANGSRTVSVIDLDGDCLVEEKLQGHRKLDRLDSELGVQRQINVKQKK